MKRSATKEPLRLYTRTGSEVRALNAGSGTLWPKVFTDALAMALLTSSALTEAAHPTPAGAEWPMFRGGPGLLGVASGQLPDRLGLLWTFKTEGPVKSSAAISGGRVYVGSDDGNLYAIDAATGKKLWAFKTGGEIESSPLVLDGKVYFGSTDAHLYALQASNGKLVWKYETGDKILSAPNWFKPPAAAAPWIVVGSYDFKLHCVDSQTGKTNWTYETGNYINGAPAVVDGKTIFGGCDALVHVISLADGQKVQEIDAGAYIAASVAAVDGRAYFGHYQNEFLCVDLEAGSVAWRFKDRAFPYFSSAAVTADRVLVGGRDKRLHCLQKSDGKEVWAFVARGKVDSSPVVCGDRVVAGSDDGRLYVVRLADGREVWSYDIGKAVTASPAVVDGRIFIGAEDGVVYAFGAKP